MLGGAGMDPGYILRHPVFLVTFIVAIPAWIIAFAGQCAMEAKFTSGSGHTPVAGTQWFNIWLQLYVSQHKFIRTSAIIIQLFLALTSDTLALHRFQISIFLAIATALAVGGVQFIFQTEGPFIASGVGWLLLTIVNLIWILYLTSEEDTLIYNLLNSRGNGGLSTHGNRRIGGGIARRDSDAYSAGMGNGGGRGELGMGGGMGGGTVGMGTGMSRGISSNNVNGASAGYGGGYAPAATDTTPQKQGPAAREYGAASPAMDDPYKSRAKALYAYSASADDPNEVSFMKGDILDVVDASGKWFQVRTPSGATGIAPSNYLAML
ncbi:hypothetical protein B9479_007006 [Cryptococcus floricola]|uniref:SH3 domain-containing protein n=1 Tax=Cryptococcus floricola TaxID=2591691 RepID=A0A5D3ANX5_9TREE|nr:hypothetical protein B9479_007006 [Cryptococcus floricola]